jgi:hypothetical protein
VAFEPDVTPRPSMLVRGDNDETTPEDALSHSSFIASDSEAISGRLAIDGSRLLRRAGRAS